MNPIWKRIKGHRYSKGFNFLSERSQELGKNDEYAI